MAMKMTAHPSRLLELLSLRSLRSSASLRWV